MSEVSRHAQEYGERAAVAGEGAATHDAESEKVCRCGWQEALLRVAPHWVDRPLSLPVAILLEQHSPEAAVEAYEQLLSTTAKPAAVWRALERLYRRLGRDEEARRALIARCRCEADQLSGREAERDVIARYLLAAQGELSPPSAAPLSYVASYFDRFAARFDRQLLEQLDYRVPELLEDLVHRQWTIPDPCLILDAGCGTGLVAARFRPLSQRLVGIDASPGMLAQAAQRGLYDQLIRGELVSELRSHATAYDLIVASDVLVYFGDLTEVLGAFRARLRPGGAAAFSVETAAEPPFTLHQSGRYQHHPDHIAAAAREAGFSHVHIERAILRREAGVPVQGSICLATG